MAKKAFRSYDDASAWAQQQGVRTGTVWNERTKRPDFPTGFPVKPNIAYRDFVQRGGWGAFLGTGAIANHLRAFRSYEGASAWARQRRIKTVREWLVRTAQPDFPIDIPKSPATAYRNAFKGWGDFLGVKTLNGTSKVELVLKHGIGRVLNLDQARTTRIDPNDTVRALHVDMADHGRRLIIEYDGHGWHKDAAKDRRKTQRLVDAGWTVIRVREAPLALLDPVYDVQVKRADGIYWPTIESVLRHMRALILSGALPDDGLSVSLQRALQSPIDEAEFYAIMTISWRSYDDARAWAQQQGIKTSAEWRARTKQPEFPADIPKKPRDAYPDFPIRGGWGGFLGTGAVATFNRSFRSYDDASAWAQQQGIKTGTEWDERTKRPDFPKDLPAKPQRTYPDFTKRGGWGAFLGTGAIANHLRTFRSYDGASAWAQQQRLQSQNEWNAASKRPDFPTDIPTNPWRIYPDFAQRGGMGAFLGTGRKRGGQLGSRRIARSRYVIRLTKPTDLTPAILPSNDPIFVMPWAA
jgi:hypothetical protein